MGTLISSGDKKFRSANVEMSSGRVIKRPLNLLIPIECRRSCENVLQEKCTLLQEADKDKDRPVSKSAEIAKTRIKQILTNEESD